MKSAILLILMAGCATHDTYCKAGYEFTYSYNSGWKQVWSVDGGGVPCESRAN